MIEAFLSSENFSPNTNEELFTELKLKTKKIFDLKSLSQIDKDQFIQVARNYIISFLKSMINRLPLTDRGVTNFRVFYLNDFSRTSWINMIELFPNLILDENDAIEELNKLRELSQKQDFLLPIENIKREKRILGNT